MSTETTPKPRIILGSSSRTRREILTAMGYTFEIKAAGIDESAIRREKPEELVMALAEAKAEAIEAQVASEGLRFSKEDPEPCLLITADQVVVHEGKIREKPEDETEARLFIESYSRSPASTVGAVLVTNLGTGFKKGGVDVTEIHFHPIPPEVVDILVKEEHTYTAAGGLLVEHPLVAPLVKSMVGTQESVMGLPRELTQCLIDAALASQKS